MPIRTMSNLESKFLLAVERAELDKVEHFLSNKGATQLNINCRDPLDRNALIIGIDNKNLEVIRLLLSSEIKLGDALLYAIQENYVEAVELLLDRSRNDKLDDLIRHGPSFKHMHEDDEYCIFSSDTTPLMLAAQKNNLEIVKLLLDRRVSPIRSPHDPRCDCTACGQARAHDCLKHSRARINAYRALASPTLMALASPDPLKTAFETSAKLEDLAQLEPEYKEDYMRLRSQCQAFATRLLDYTRTSKELEVLLDFGDDLDDSLAEESPAAAEAGEAKLDSRKRRENFAQCRGPPRRRPCGVKTSRLARLKLAIQCKQKTFCAHPNIQELLASMWYENLPGFRNGNVFNQSLQVLCIGLLFPFYSLAYLVAPHTQLGLFIKKPFIKFICHSASYITFILLLVLASQRVEAFYSWSSVTGLFVSSSSSSSSASMGSGPAGTQAGVHLPHGLVLQEVTTNASVHQSPANRSAPPNVLLGLDLAQVRLKHKDFVLATGGGGRGSSSARGLDSLTKIFEELPASSKKRGTLPSPIESVILIWVFSLIWAEIKQIKALGINYYRHDMWNLLDSVASGCYVGTIILRLVSYCQSDELSMEVPREQWHAYDPTLLSEGLFATATIFSSLKLIYIFSVNPYLGPLQISLGRMIVDILRFSWIYMLVLFAFACGMNQLLWYYADLERHQCLNVTNYNLAQLYEETTATSAGTNLSLAASLGLSEEEAQDMALDMHSAFEAPSSVPQEPPPPQQPPQVIKLNANEETKPHVGYDEPSCKAWRHFSNVFESVQTLFWANFGLVDLENFDLTGIRQYTRFWALLMFGCYCFINVIVVLNLLIAMMNHSYVKISTRSDIEWKFARTRLWMSYFENGSTVPAPFNIIPSLKSARYALERLLFALRPSDRWAKSKTLQPPGGASVELPLTNPATPPLNSRVHNYELVIKALVRRYLVDEQRQVEKKSALTEAKLERWSKLNVFTS